METLKPIILENFINNADSLFQKIRETVNWDERIKARKTASFGVAYNYSGITYPEVPMMTCLTPICDKIKSKIGFYPNNCLINYYVDGNSKMGYHSDSAAELQEGTGVTILSLGAVRTISFRSKLNKEHKVKYKLTSGTLLYMDNDVQEKWMHAIPREKGRGERISLTFRQIIN
ncbi:MAG: alpha-ketoglutarate-dependent dioxygenase AlkB [Pleurocapsa sp.]